MAIELTSAAQLASEQNELNPQLVLEIEGVPTTFGAVRILRMIHVGDPGLTIGSGWKVGDKVELENSDDAISLQSSSSQIKQQIEPEKGSVSSISSMQIELVDFANEVSQIVSPGVVITDILAAEATVKMGFANTAYPDDYFTIFQGLIDDVEAGPGSIKINIAHPEQKKRQAIFQKAITYLNGSINNSATTLTVDDTTSFLSTYSSTPTAVADNDITYYVRIDDEIIKYTGKTDTTFTTCTRGQLGTTAASHDDNAEVTSFYVLEGLAIDLALKIMYSGKNGPWREDVGIESFVSANGETDLANSIFFLNLDLADKYGVQAGDYITTTGASNGANNVSLKQIESIDLVDTGTRLVVSGVSFVLENTSAAVCSFRSQYDTLGEGLALGGNQIDTTAHEYWRDLLLSTISMRFYLKDTINGKDFLDKEIYAPIGAFSIPRKGRCSMGYHVGPYARDGIKILDKTNIINPSRLKLKRSSNKNFYNTIVYKTDQDVLEDKFLGGYIWKDTDSTSRIDIGNKVFLFESTGLRTDLSAATHTSNVSRRLLNRYKYGAEYFQGVQVMFGDGFNLEPGDMVLVDFTDLNVVNTVSGTRNKPTKLFEVTNRSLDIRTGNITLDLIDTNLDYSERFGVVSPSSILTGAGSNYVVIDDSYGAKFPGEEWKKWINYLGEKIRVHSTDFTVDQTVTLDSQDSSNLNKFYVTPSFSPIPSVGHVMEIGAYPDNTDAADNALSKSVFTFLSPTVDVTAGSSSTSFTVGLTDSLKFVVGGFIRVHSIDYTVDSGTTLLSVETINTGTGVITTNKTLGFTPAAGQKVDLIGFKDGGQAYRFF